MPRFRVPHADKLAHVGMYAVLMLLLLRAIGIRRGLTREAIVAFLVCAAYGIAMECGQLLADGAGRTFSLDDIVANLLGAGSAIVAVGWKRSSKTSGMHTDRIVNTETP